MFEPPSIHSCLPPNWLDLPLLDLAQLAPIQTLHWPLAQACGVEVVIKREDLLDAFLGGNKFYKLYYHLKAARAQQASQIISFGGAFSNHLYALAKAAQGLGLQAIAVVRGDEVLSPTLIDIQEMGTQLHFVSRSDYRRKTQPDFRAELLDKFGPSYLIPEGGGDWLGATGMCELAKGLPLCHWPPGFSVSPEGVLPVDVLAIATGTGASLAGIVSGARVPKVMGVSALKLGVYQHNYRQDIEQLIKPLSGYPLPEWWLEDRFSFGGYARYPDELAQFVCQFEKDTGVPLDPVYGAKLFCAIAHHLQTDWPRGTRVLVLHTGGLQGKRGAIQLTASGYKAGQPI